MDRFERRNDNRTPRYPFPIYIPIWIDLKGAPQLIGKIFFSIYIPIWIDLKAEADERL